VFLCDFKYLVVVVGAVISDELGIPSLVRLQFSVIYIVYTLRYYSIYHFKWT
jgi:hypothetical protein